MKKRFSIRASHRPGMTVLEVLFAIGIAIVGLLGIASLLPLAGRNAGDSVRTAEAQALAHQWNDDLLVRDIVNPANWQFYHDYTVSGMTLGWNSWGNLPTSRNQYNNSLRPINKQAVCIDPNFMTSRDLGSKLVNFSPGANSCLWYRPSVFPYYLDTYNPAVDPVYTVSAQSSYAYALDQPRMVRVALGSSTAILSSRAVQQLFSSLDDLAIDTEANDKSVPATRNLTAGTGTLTNAKMTNNGNYTWLATLVPTDTLLNVDSVDSALLSVVVIHKRDLIYFDPTTPPSRGSQPDIEDKPQGERLFNVSVKNSTGAFRGGHAGTVTLSASDGVSNVIHVGDWLMLARNRRVLDPITGNPTTTPVTTIPVYRWYRVISVDDSPDLYPNATVPDGYWERDVVLEGPDWVFDTTGANPTTATYIPGAVAVYERMIER